jgi:hypothetical protein
VPGKKDAVADGLSRKPPGPSDALDKEEQDIEDFIDGELDLVRVAPISVRLGTVRARVYPMATVEGRTEEQREDFGDAVGDEAVEEEDENDEEEWDPERGEKLRSGYSEESIAIARYLTTLKRPSPPGH